MVLGVLKGEPLVSKAAKVTMYGVFPAAMIAALIYSLPGRASTRKPEPKPVDSRSPSS